MKLKQAIAIRDRYIQKLSYLRFKQGKHNDSPYYDFLTALVFESQVDDTSRMIKRYSTLIRQRCTV